MEIRVCFSVENGEISVFFFGSVKELIHWKNELIRFEVNCKVKHNERLEEVSFYYISVFEVAKDGQRPQNLLRQ